jgi:hypothetical protein
LEAAVLKKLIWLTLITAFSTPAFSAPGVTLQAEPLAPFHQQTHIGHYPGQSPVAGQQLYFALMLNLDYHSALDAPGEDLYLTSLTISIEGTADDAVDFSAIRLYVGPRDNRVDYTAITPIGSASSFDADDGTVTFDGLHVLVKAPVDESHDPIGVVLPTMGGDQQSLHVACDIAPGASIGSTFRLFVNGPEAYVVETADGTVVPNPVPLDSPQREPVAIYPVKLPYFENNVGTINEPRQHDIRRGTADVVLGEMQFAAHVYAWRLTMIALGVHGSLGERWCMKNVRIYRDVNENGLLDEGDELMGGPAPVEHQRGGTFYGRSTEDGLAFFEDLDYVFEPGIPETWLAVGDLDRIATVGNTFILHPGMYQLDVADSALASLSFNAGQIHTGVWPTLTVKDIERPTAVSESVPDRFQLRGAVPNPFNPMTTIRFGLAEAGLTSVSVYTISGQRVRVLSSGTMTPGRHEVVWDGRDHNGAPAASGVYLYRVTSNNKRLVGRMTLAR